MPSLRSSAEFPALVARLRTGLGLMGRGFGVSAAAFLRLAWLVVKRVGGVALALVLLFEQWGWRPLSAVLARLAQFAPIAACERVIAGLPPFGALLVFGAPVVLLVPLKLAALYLITTGHAVSAGAVFIGAKVVGTAIVARLYALTEPQLMQIGWFKWAHEVIAPRVHALHAEIRASWAWRYGRVVKWGAKRAAAAAIERLRSEMLSWFAGRTPQA